MFPLRDAQPSYSRPVVTVLLIIVNLVVFLYESMLDPYSLNHFVEVYGLVPANLHLTSLFTSMFLHGGWMHVLGNLWFLWIFGDNVEDVLGHGKYLMFYLLSGVAAAAGQIIVNPDSGVPMVGASGAIAGVMGAYIVKFPHARILTLVFIFLFITTVEVPAVLMLAYWFIIQLFSGVGSIARTHATQGGVAFFAHVGGFVAGMVLVKVLGTKQPYRRRRDLTW
ncbi:MAG: rhomboid family intramembrane serine protease [Bryobacteraceae bacterium]